MIKISYIYAFVLGKGRVGLFCMEDYHLLNSNHYFMFEKWSNPYSQTFEPNRKYITELNKNK